MSKVSREVAVIDVERWLDANKVWRKKREALDAMVSNLIEAVVEGLLVVNEDNTLTQHLSMPIGNDGFVSDLKYKQRITSVDLDAARRIVKGDNFEDGITRCIMAFTGQPLNVVRMLDRATDLHIAESIVVFFS